MSETVIIKQELLDYINKRIKEREEAEQKAFNLGDHNKSFMEFGGKLELESLERILFMFEKTI